MTQPMAFAAPTQPVASTRIRARSLRWGDAWGLSALTVLVLLLTEVPYLYGYLSAPPDRRFMGILMNVPDTAQYLSWARESSKAILIENKLTSEPGAAVYFNLFWLVVGRLAGGLNLGFAEAAQVVRPVAGAAYVAAIYWIVGLFARDRWERWTATLVAVLGGGFGWLLVLYKTLTGAADVAFPLDLYVTEPNTFLSIMAFPLQATAGALLLGILGLAVLAFERNNFRLAAIAGLLGLLLGLQHGYDLVIVYGVVGLTSVLLACRRPFSRRPLLLAAMVCGWAFPALAYLGLLTRFSPIWRGALSQYGNAGVYTPTPPHLLVLLGLPLVLTVGGTVALAPRLTRGGVRQWLEAMPPRRLLLWVWLLLGGLLLYIPTDFQIKMLVGWQVPVSIVGTQTLLALTRRASAPSRQRVLRLACAGLVLAVIPTNAYLLAWRVADLSRFSAPYYLQIDEVAALDWLEVNARPTDVVFSSETTGAYVPSRTGTSAFLAHWAMTLDYFQKRRIVGQVFNAATPESTRMQLLATSQATYLIRGPSEKALGSFDPETSRGLVRVFSQSSVDVFRITEPGTREGS